MKRVVQVCGLILLLICLCACQSEEAKVVDEQIRQIGTVTLEKKALIEEIGNKITNLSEKDRKKLRYYYFFKTAKIELQVLECEEAIKALPEKIAYDENCKMLIEEARDKFWKIPIEDRDKVDNYNVLIHVEREFKKLEAEYEASRKEEELKQIRSKLRWEPDAINGITYYFHKEQPFYDNSRSYALPYMGNRDNSYWLRWKILYTGDDWCFWTNLTFSVDGQNYYHAYDYFEVTRDNQGGDVWEYVDISVDEGEKILLEKIANSERTIIRFEGKNRYYDLWVSDEDKQAIKDILTAYDLLTED